MRSEIHLMFIKLTIFIVVAMCDIVYCLHHLPPKRKIILFEGAQSIRTIETLRPTAVFPFTSAPKYHVTFSSVRVGL